MKTYEQVMKIVLPPRKLKYIKCPEGVNINSEKVFYKPYRKGQSGD